MGVLSAVPVVNLGNVCCCLWVILGGVVAAYLLQEQEPAPINVSDGAIVGLFAGIFGAVVALVISIPVRLMLAPLQRMVFDRLSQSGQLPPQFESFIASSALGVIGLIISFVFMLCAGAIFSTAGGVLGVAIFNKKTPPGVIDIPPTPPPTF
jgi:hypothetical protein